MDTWIVAGMAGIVGAALGAVLAYLWAERQSRALAGNLEKSLAVGEQKNLSLAQEIAAAREQFAREHAENGAVHAQLAESQAQSAALAAQLAASEKNISQQKQLLDEAHKKLTDAFATVSQSALARSNEAFLQMAEARFKTLSAQSAGSLDERKAQIGTLLKPLEEALAGYQKRLAETESARTTAYGELLKQIGSMSTTQQTLSSQTAQLVSALKKSNVRGRWGEIALERLAEIAGMTPHVDFSPQLSTRTDEGRMLRPDMTVHLPGNRSVVVDAKAVMNAFLDALGATDEAARQQFMLAHARNIRSRIDDLAGKAYWNQLDSAPEFVVLFLPAESFLYAACERDPDLIQYAISQRVLLATPTTFIGLLQTIEYGWRQQTLTENADEIRKLGVEIYDRLATLAGNMARLGSSLDNAVDHYNKTIGTLDGRVLVSVRKMAELGAATDKEIPELPPVDKRTREAPVTRFP